jgi:hypothetical protein
MEGDRVMSIPMASFTGVLAYGNATLASATEICEVESSDLGLEREQLECSPRCSPGKKVFMSGELTTNINAELAILKAASNGSFTDFLLTTMLNNDTLTHVWFVDAYNDGVYIAEATISSFTVNQNVGEVCKASMTLIPATDVKRVLNGSVVSS